MVECAAWWIRLSRARMGSWTEGWWSTLVVGDVSSTWSPPEGRGSMSGMGDASGAVVRRREENRLGRGIPPAQGRRWRNANPVDDSLVRNSAVFSRTRPRAERQSRQWQLGLRQCRPLLWQTYRHHLSDPDVGHLLGVLHPELHLKVPHQPHHLHVLGVDNFKSRSRSAAAYQYNSK